MARDHMISGESGWDPYTFEEVPRGTQRLCCNETVTKLNVAAQEQPRVFRRY